VPGTDASTDSSKKIRDDNQELRLKMKGILPSVTNSAAQAIEKTRREEELWSGPARCDSSSPGRQGDWEGNATVCFGVPRSTGSLRGGGGSVAVQGVRRSKKKTEERERLIYAE